MGLKVGNGSLREINIFPKSELSAGGGGTHLESQSFGGFQDLAHAFCQRVSSGKRD